MLALAIQATYLSAALLYLPSPPRPVCVQFDHPPTPDCNGVLTVNVGETLQFTVQASDPVCPEPVFLEAALLELQGALTVTPPLPTTGNPVSVTVTWTPDVNMIGTHSITFHAVGACCPDDSWCNMTVDVRGTPTGCTLTPGFWKTHSCSWPSPFVPGAPDPTDANHNGINDNVENQCGTTRRSPYAICPCDPTNTMLVGTIAYDQCELLCGLANTGTGNAMRILAPALIAAKLNALEGSTTSVPVSDPLNPSNPYNGSTVDQLIAEADSLIGGANILTTVIGKADFRRAPMIQVAALLDLYNNGLAGVPHCE